MRATPTSFADYPCAMRVVSLTCSNTEIVCALGCADMLVGVDDHSDFPEEVVGALPRMGPDLHIVIERVEALAPDLVLASLTVPGHEEVVAGVEGAGLNHIAPEPTSLEDVYTDIATVAGLLGVPERGERLIDEMRRELGEPVEVADDAPTVMIQWWPKPSIVPGRLSWTTDVLSRVGGRNPLGEEEVKSRPLADDEVARLAPDAIVISWCGVHPDKYRPDVVYRNPSLADVPAVRNGKVFCVPEAYLGRPGPRLVDGYRALRDVVRDVAGR